LRELPDDYYNKYCHNWIVWDIEKDNLLKLGRDKKILLAMNAF